MFHKIKSIEAMENMKIKVTFVNETKKLYDMQKLIEKRKEYQELKNNVFFKTVKVDTGGYGIYWNENLDLSCEELWENGITV